MAKRPSATRGAGTSPLIDEDQRTRESLAAWGAPLGGVGAESHFPFHETLLRGLIAARTNGTLLRALPATLANGLAFVDWPALRELARRWRLKAELGFLVELTAELLGHLDLAAEAATLVDCRSRMVRFFPDAPSCYEKQLARIRAPEVALRWGFWMNITVPSFRAALDT